MILSAWTLAAGLLLQTGGPSIELWYGDAQVFGKVGHPQRWINVLGNVADEDGVAWLAVRLNGGAKRMLSIGPDQRRLLDSGDFNVELDRAELLPGDNTLELIAADGKTNEAAKLVTVTYVPESAWPRDYSVDWSSASRVDDVVQIVDGRWLLENGGLRTDPAHVGYDRLVAIGDETWDDYEVTVPITLHAIDERAYDSKISYAPAIAIDLRWLGHTDMPAECGQPHCGWEPGGASNVFTWSPDGASQLHIFAEPIHYPWKKSATTDALSFDVGETKWFKARVETTPTGSLYSLKMWPDGDAEPDGWLLQRMTTLANLKRGSFLLKAHHVDVTFGALAIAPLAQMTWSRASKVSSVLVRSPLLLFAVAALGLALARRRDDPAFARRATAAALCLLAGMTLDIWLELRLPDAMADGGWSAKELTLASRVGEGVRTLLVAVGGAILLVGMARRAPQSKEVA